MDIEKYYQEKKNKDEEAPLMSRRGFLKKVAVVGGVIATGGLANLMVDEAERAKKVERERTEISPGVVIGKEIEKPEEYGPEALRVSTEDYYYIRVAVGAGAHVGRFEVTKSEYDSYVKGENVTVEYFPDQHSIGIYNGFDSTKDVRIKSVKK